MNGLHVSRLYTAVMFDVDAKLDRLVRTLYCEPSARNRCFDYSSYGIGHTAWREPGDTRGTAVGKKGRWRACWSMREEVII